MEKLKSYKLIIQSTIEFTHVVKLMSVHVAEELDLDFVFSESN